MELRVDSPFESKPYSGLTSGNDEKGPRPRRRWPVHSALYLVFDGGDGAETFPFMIPASRLEVAV